MFQNCRVPSYLNSRLDSSVSNVEVNINGYSIIRNDRNRNGGGAACYIRSDLCFNNANILPNSCFFFKFLSQKLNLLYLEYFTDLQMQKTFEKHFQTIYYKFTTKLKKFIF